MSEGKIRFDERRLIADLLERDASAITSYTNDDSSTLRLVVAMLRLTPSAAHQEDPDE